MENYTKSEKNHAKYPVFTQNFYPRYLLKKERNLRTSLLKIGQNRPLMLEKNNCFN